MVLLTSSAVSAAISAGVVCIFTFLLFLSGYVLQQQSVRSLQEAIRNPPEKPWYPTPVLPAQFQDPGEDLVPVGTENETVRGSNGQQPISNQEKQEKQHGLESTQSSLKIGGGFQQQTPLQLWREYVTKQQVVEGNSADPLQGSGATSMAIDQDGEEEEEDSIYFQNPSERERLAYILATPAPSDLCSVAVFVRQYRSGSTIESSPPSLVLIYPATWEVSDSPAHVEAMDMIRELQDKSDVICHPVSISRVWAGIDMETQLLAELQRTRWAYTRAMYLRSPGMVLDVHRLDRALVFSLPTKGRTSKQDLPKSWTTLSSKSTSSKPALLLYVREKGLLAPTAEMKEFAIEIGTSPDHEIYHEPHLNTSAKKATYLVFEEDDLRRRRRHKESYTGTIFERFEQERRQACSGTTLLKTTRKVDEKLASRRTSR